MLKICIYCFILLTFVISVFAHNTHEVKEQIQDITVKTIKITEKVYMIQGRGGNIAVSVGTDGILIVDDDYADVSLKIAEALKTLGADKPKFIFNTHWHGDHTQGNHFFGKDSLIFSHTNVRQRLAVESIINGRKFPAYPLFALPVVTFDKSITIHFNADEIKAVHYPSGHTDGDSVIYFMKENVVHTGDDFLIDGFPFIDLENGGSVQGLIRNLAEIITQLPPDVKIIPGHGRLATLENLKRYRQTLFETMMIIEEGMKAGKSLDQLKKEGLPAKYESWGDAFLKTDVWIETVYKSLSKK